jgi:hypothetical protein
MPSLLKHHTDTVDALTASDNVTDMHLGYLGSSKDMRMFKGSEYILSSPEATNQNRIISSKSCKETEAEYHYETKHVTGFVCNISESYHLEGLMLTAAIANTMCTTFQEEPKQLGDGCSTATSAPRKGPCMVTPIRHAGYSHGCALPPFFEKVPWRWFFCSRGRSTCLGVSASANCAVRDVMD